MSDDPVTVDVEITTEPFGVKGAITVDDSVFEMKRQSFKVEAARKINRLSHDLLEEAMNEFDRRNGE